MLFIAYLPKQVFDVETGLNWKRMPDWSYISKELKIMPGYKAAKDRLTLLFHFVARWLVSWAGNFLLLFDMPFHVLLLVTASYRMVQLPFVCAVGYLVRGHTGQLRCHCAICWVLSAPLCLWGVGSLQAYLALIYPLLYMLLLWRLSKCIELGLQIILGCFVADYAAYTSICKCVKTKPLFLMNRDTEIWFVAGWRVILTEASLSLPFREPKSP